MIGKFSSASNSNRRQCLHLQCAQVVGHLNVVDLAVCICTNKDKGQGPTTANNVLIVATNGLLKQASPNHTSKHLMQHQHRKPITHCIAWRICEKD